MHKYNLLEAGLLTKVNTDGLATDTDGNKAFDKDLSYNVIIDDADYGIVGKLTQTLLNRPATSCIHFDANMLFP